MISNGGKENFQRWKESFPPLEIYFSKAGKFLETCGRDSSFDEIRATLCGEARKYLAGVARRRQVEPARDQSDEVKAITSRGC